MYEHFPDPPTTPSHESTKQLIAPNEIPGNWIHIKCSKCGRPMKYWSLSGQPKPEYSKVECKDVLGIGKCSKGGRK